MKRALSLCLVMAFFVSMVFVSGAEARPSWISVKYSGFTVHRNSGQNDPAQPGYYFAQIKATCTNNGSQVVTGLSSRSMGFTAEAFQGSTPVGTGKGSISINEPASLDPVNPGESFAITYSVPIMAIEGGSLEQFNSSGNARLRKYKLQHYFTVMTK